MERKITSQVSQSLAADQRILRPLPYRSEAVRPHLLLEKRTAAAKLNLNLQKVQLAQGGSLRNRSGGRKPEQPVCREELVAKEKRRLQGSEHGYKAARVTVRLETVARNLFRREKSEVFHSQRSIIRKAQREESLWTQNSTPRSDCSPTNAVLPKVIQYLSIK